MLAVCSIKIDMKVGIDVKFSSCFFPWTYTRQIKEKETQRAAHRVWYFVGWEHKATRNWKTYSSIYACCLFTPLSSSLILALAVNVCVCVWVCVSLVNRINFVDCRDLLLGTALLVQSQIIVIIHLFVKIRRDNYRFQWICYCWALLLALMGCLWKLIIKQVSNTSFFRGFEYVGICTSISTCGMWPKSPRLLLLPLIDDIQP